VSPLAVAYYDGRTARRHAATASHEAGWLILRGDFGERRESLAALDIAEALGGGPRLLRFADGALCEVADRAACAAWLAEAGYRESVVVRSQRHWRWAGVALTGLAGALAVTYFWLLPAAAELLAPRIPRAALDSLSHQVLNQLDEHVLRPSALAESQRQAILAETAAVVEHRPGAPAYRLLFRKSPLGPNAFALPNGDIVVFDELVKLARGNDEVAAVIAHELGHVARHHGVRQVIQSSVVSFVVGVYLGDVSSLVTGLGALVLQSRYSREFETEADAYGGALLLAAGRSPALLAAMLERLEQARERKGGGTGGADWLASHPDTARRVAVLRAQH